MFDIGMAEMVVIGVVALIVVGPKDLPMMFRRAGQFVGRMRGMARDFQRAMDQAADDSGLKDVADSVKTATTMKNLGLDDAAKSLAAVNADWEAKKPKKIDAAAEHAARQKAVEEANEAAAQWPPEGVETATKEAADGAEPSGKPEIPEVGAGGTAKPKSKKAAVKKPARKTGAKTPPAKTSEKQAPAKKPAAKKTPSRKPAASKAASKKPAASKTSARKTAKDKAGDDA